MLRVMSGILWRAKDRNNFNLHAKRRRIVNLKKIIINNEFQIFRADNNLSRLEANNC